MNTNETPSPGSLHPVVSLPASDQKTIVAALVAVARAAWQLADNTEERDNDQFLCDPGDFAKLSAALDTLDQWPDPLGESATGPRKAEYWYELGGKVDAPRQANNAIYEPSAVNPLKDK